MAACPIDDTLGRDTWRMALPISILEIHKATSDEVTALGTYCWRGT